MKINRLIMSVIGGVACAWLLGFSGTAAAAEATAKSRTESVQVSPLTTTVNINTANIEMLAALNGIGEKKAADIIAYREANGKFAKIEDLLNVKGIGEKTLENNRAYLSVN